MKTVKFANAIGETKSPDPITYFNFGEGGNKLKSFLIITDNKEPIFILGRFDRDKIVYKLWAEQYQPRFAASLNTRKQEIYTKYIQDLTHQVNINCRKNEYYKCEINFV